MMEWVALLSAFWASLPAPPQNVTAGGGFAARGLADCNSDLRHINHLTGWQIRWRQEWSELAHASDDEIRRAIAHWRTAPQALQSDRQALASDAGASAPKVIVEHVLQQTEALSVELTRTAPDLRDDAPSELQSEWRRLFANEIGPAVAAYALYLRRSYLPVASHSPGLSSIPGGPECFRAAYQFYSSVDDPVEAIEQTGWKLVRETGASLAKLYGQSGDALPGLLGRLRDHREPGFDRQRLLAVSQAAALRGSTATPRLFARPASRTIVVFEPVPPQMETGFPAASYLGSHGDGPAIALLNLSRPAERRLFAEAIAFHETLPGHHVTEAFDYPLGARPNSGFIEGWGMYAEQLADETGLYSGELDRAGMLARRLAAAARPIIEVGLHHRGWTRAQAVQFLYDHSVLSHAEIENEVDRMIAGPGQPLSYVLGYDAIVSARAQAQASLGPAFDLRQFHEQVLSKGARPLQEMRADVLQWSTLTRTREGQGASRR